ncbi:MAG: tRNA (N6-threonylcarbamoyladenosine(37)-N6)-methyltransferase TrmO [Clostridiales bacterium]|nr:tRNA (N6-threonylcarbamoyladenosine(37)-N6)-methyltransferase TrmO [Candidatus Equinaster intestinalis]
MEIIAHIETDFKTKFGLPRQSLLAGITGRIVFEPKYRVKEAFRGLEDFSHIWLLWEFSECKRADWSPTVRPPLLGGNTRMGVFATRSPYRPNNIGLSAVKLEKIDFNCSDAPVLYVSGADLMNGTPIYDIKPYLPYADSIENATGGFTETLSERKLEVEIPKDLLLLIPSEKREELISVLSLDPRPSYIEDPERIYGFLFAEFEIKFKVNKKQLIVTEIL